MTTILLELEAHSAALGTPPKGCAETDPRKLVFEAWRYLRRNAERMHYDAYRRQGLPIMTSAVESVIKMVNRRVKGTEKFWNDGPSGEAILQLRAAVISDGDRLQHWITNRPISPFSPKCRSTVLANSP